MRPTRTCLCVMAFALVVASAFIATSPGAASPFLTANRNIQAQRAPSTITIDGSLAEWPSGYVFVLDATTAQYTAGSIRSVSDLSLSLQVLWDNEYLYAGAIVTDDVRLADSTNIWDDDGLEIALDGLRDGRCCGSDDHQFTVATDGRLADFGVILPPGTTPLRVAVQQQSGRHVIELAIPLTSLTTVRVGSGTVMGINVALNDDDDGGRRDKRLVWVGNTTLDFASMGTLTFVGAGTPAATPTVSPTGVPVATGTPTSPVATATATATSSAPTATATPTSPPTATPTMVPQPVTATPTLAPTARPTQSVDARLAALEGNLSTLEGRILTILDILQRAGRFPDAGRVAAATSSILRGGITDPRAYVQGVNCGGSAYTTIGGDFYAADQPYVTGGWGYLSGQSAQIANAIANTDDDVLYQSERYNMSGYAFDLPPGSYEVLLRFAETYPYIKQRGRVFDIVIEGVVVERELDILARVETYTALDLTYTAVVSDGQLNIGFVPVAGVPTVKAILVRGVGLVGPTPTPSVNDRLQAISARLTNLEGLIAAILEVFRTTQGQPATPTPVGTVVTQTPAVATPTRTATSSPAVSTPTRTPPRSPSATPTRTPTPGGPTPTARTSAKKGVGGSASPELLREVGIAWAYTWYIAANNFNTVYEHVPMIFGASYDAATVTAVARAHPGSYWLIWNEPDYWQQANMSPVEAAQSYRVLRPLIKNADPTAKLIVGGVFNLNVGWLQNFRQEYYRLYNEWPVVEGWHVHHYAGRTEYDSATWRSKLVAVRDWMMNNGGQVELWLTEFGCLNSDAVAYQVMADQVSWLEAQPWLTRYAWYATYAAGPGCETCTGSLFNTDGSLTDLGRLYRSLP